MGGGEREGEELISNVGSAAVVGNGTSASLKVVSPAAADNIAPPPRAPASVAVVVPTSGGGGAVEKVKFTVSVRGHQWSSARHVNETLQEFATAIQRNARRLEFIKKDDSIQRLQLAYGDGSDPEDLDVDATLGDVIICMGDKQLVAIVNSTKASPSKYPSPCSNGASTRPDAPPGSPTRIAFAGAHHNGLINTKSSKSDAPPAANGNNNGDHSEITTRFMNFPPYKPPSKTKEPASRALRIAVPPQADSAVPFQHNVDRACSGFQSDYMNSSNLPPLGPSRSNAKVVLGGCKQSSHSHSHSHGHVQGGYCPRATPSPAELANMLVRSSSHQHRVGMGMGMGMQQQQHQQPGGSMTGQCNNRSNVESPAPSGGFQSFTSALLSRLPVLPNQNSLQCPHGASTNIALLAQFLASQLRAFNPAENSRSTGAAHPSSTDPSPCGENRAADVSKDAMNATTGAGGAGGGYVPPPPNGSSNGQSAIPEKEMNLHNYPGHTVDQNGHSSPKNDNNVKLSVSGSHEKEESSSSANVYATANAGPTGDVVDSAHQNGSRNELVFLVNRRSKTGVGTHHLKMTDLSTYFHLSVVDAAKKLGVSQTTLKKACRKFGLKRWPGRKVRSLESTIHGLEHTIAAGQGAGLEELTEAYMRNEVQKLQQEMDQLVHGTPAQHSPAVRTADLYKRLYSRGWRSKYHSSGRHDVDLNNTGNDENRPSGLGPQSAKKATETTRVANPAAGVKKVPVGSQTNYQQQKHHQKPKGDQQPVQTVTDVTARSKQGSDVTVMKDVDIEGLLREPSSKDSQQAISAAVPVNVPVDNGTVVNCTGHTRNGTEERDHQVVVEEKEVSAFQERSPKRPKRECRTAAEAAVRQGLRSSTCAIHPKSERFKLPKLELKEEFDAY